MHIASSAEARICTVCTCSKPMQVKTAPGFVKSHLPASHQRKLAMLWQSNATPLSLRNGQHLLGPHSQRSSSRNIGELDAMYVCTRSSQRCLCHPISLPLRWEECGKAGGRLCWTTPQDNRRFCKIVVDSRANSRKHFLESSLKNRPVEFLSIPFDSWLVVVLQELHVSQKGLAARTSWTVIEGIDEQSST